MLRFLRYIHGFWLCGMLVCVGRRAGRLVTGIRNTACNSATCLELRFPGKHEMVQRRKRVTQGTPLKAFTIEKEKLSLHHNGSGMDKFDREF